MPFSMVLRLSVLGIFSVALAPFARSETLPSPSNAPKQTTNDGLVRMNFPNPTSIHDIARFVAVTFNKPTIVDMNSDTAIQIIADKPLPRAEAYQRYLEALQKAGLSAVERQGVTRIMPVGFAKSERIQNNWASVRLPQLRSGATSELVSMDYPEPTEIATIIRNVSEWSGLRVVTDVNVNGKISIFSPQKMSRDKAYYLYLSALAQVGLGERDRGFVIQIQPYMTLNSKVQNPLHFPAPPSDSDNEVTFNFPEATEVTDVLNSTRGWYKRDLQISPALSGKLHIYAQAPMAAGDAYKVLVAALDQLGYTSYLADGAVQVTSYRDFNNLRKD